MVYNLTGMASNSTSVLSLFQGVNDVLMLGWLGTMFLIAVTVIIAISVYVVTNDTNRTIASSMFLCLVMALFLKAVDLIPGLVLYIVLIGTAVAVAFTWKRN